MYKIIIDNNKEYGLIDWNSQSFIEVSGLLIVSEDVNELKETFSAFNKIDIYREEELYATLDTFNTYVNITYNTNVYNGYTGQRVGACFVELMRSNTVQELVNLKESLENTMVELEPTFEDKKQEIFYQIADSCMEDIYAGTEINGHHFSYKAEDQTNLKTLFDTVIMAPQIQGLPYHADGEPCRFFSREEIVTIYTTLMSRLIGITTYCNALNMMVKEITTEEGLENIYYGMPLDEERQIEYNMIMSQTQEAFNSILNGLVGE